MEQLAPRTSWPELPLEAWHDTLETIHRWSQILGKIKLALTPRVNHWWNVGLEPTARGLATGAMPYGDRWFELELDFVDHALHLRTSDGGARSAPLRAQSVAEFFRATMALLDAAGIDVRIWPVPVEIENPIPLDRDEEHHAYDRRYVRALREIVARSAQVMRAFRARFVGKASPVQLFWGTFDLSTSRFSGRRAPGPAPANPIEREAYSHEVQSVGWWPGDSRLPHASYFSYIAPEPAGYAMAAIATPGASYEPKLHGFYLPYDEVRGAAHPEALLLDFFQETYAAAADLAGWDRAALERAPEASGAV